MAWAKTGQRNKALTSYSGGFKIARPVGAAKGQLLLACVNLHGSPPTITATNFTKQQDATFNVGGDRWAIFWKVDDGSQEFEVSWSGSHEAQGFLFSFSGNAEAPYDISSFRESVGLKTIPTTSISLAGKNELLINLSAESFGEALTQPAGFTEIVDEGTEETHGLHVAWKEATEAGETGEQNFSGAATIANGAGVLIAFKPIAAAPTNSVLPALSGTAKVGQTLSSTEGTWTGSPTYAYQWEHSANGVSGWATIPSATSSSYLIAVTYQGEFLRCTVTATNEGGSAAASSAASAQVAAEGEAAATFSAPIPPPPQIIVTAIAEGGNGRAYDLTDEIEGLSWSNVNPGGDEICSFTLNRSWFAENPEVEKGNLLRVVSGIDVLWQGRVEEIDRSMGDAEALAVTCYGLANRLGDITFREIYLDADLSKWAEMSIQRRINLISESFVFSPTAAVGFQEAGVTAAGIIFDFSGVTKIEALKPGMELYYNGGGIDLGRLIYDFLGDGTTTWTEIPQLCTDDVQSSSDAPLNLNGTSVTQKEVVASVAGRKFGVLQSFYTGAFLGQMTNRHVYQNVKMLGRHGLSLKGSWPLVGLSADQIVGHIISKASGIVTRLFSTFPYNIPQFVVDTPTTPKDAIPQVNEYANADYGTWGPNSPFDNSTNGYFDFTEPQPSTQHWFALRADFEGDLAFHTETSSLYDTVDVSWTDEANASHVERYSITSPDLKAAGLSPRIFPLNLGMTTKAGAQIEAEIFLQLFAGFAPARGSGTISRPLRHYRRGILPPYYLRADGSNMRIPDILSAETTFSLDSTPDRRTTFPIKRVSVDCSGDIPRTSVEFDQTNDSMAMLLAQEAAQAALIG
jgi:hypothetical protein